jgi:hypothetical protein
MSMETEAALFHLDKAAREFKNLKAMAIFASKLLGQETDELEDLNVKKVFSSYNKKGCQK